jgi:hypothetical protein
LAPKAVGWGEGIGVGENRGEMGDLAAQNAVAAEGPVQADSGEGINRAGTEPWEIVYFKLLGTQIPVVEQAIETGAWATILMGEPESCKYPSSVWKSALRGRS